MPLYTFHMCDPAGYSTCFVARELPSDSDTFPAAAALLTEHASAAYVAVWDDERPVISHHRVEPLLRPLGESPAVVGLSSAKVGQD